MASTTGTGAVRVRGLKELQRAFRKMDKDVAQDLVWELQEAADPVRKLSTELILGELVNMPRTPEYADMRIGVSGARGAVYVAPAWRRTGGSPRPSLGASMGKRMEAAVETKAGDVEKRLGDWLDRMADEWGRGA